MHKMSGTAHLVDLEAAEGRLCLPVAAAALVELGEQPEPREAVDGQLVGGEDGRRGHEGFLGGLAEEQDLRAKESAWRILTPSL